MGWSCRAEAGKVIDLWTAKCRAETGSSNTYKHKNTERFFDVSRTEHFDGAITGTLWEVIPGSREPNILTGAGSDSFFSKKVGSFKIDGDGSFVRGPAFLKEFSAKVLISGYSKGAPWE